MSIYRSRDQGPRGGAEHLARIHGTEEDKVNCPFYFKIGDKKSINNLISGLHNAHHLLFII